MNGVLKESKFTSLILLINVVVFALIVINGGPNSDTLVRFGASNYELIKNGQFYRIFTQIFVHHSWIHFLFNMLVIYMMVPSVEQKFGPYTLVGVYFLVCLLDGLLMPLIHDNWIASGGASGGYFGLYGLAIGTLFIYKDEGLNRWASQFILPMTLIMLGTEIYFRITQGSPERILDYNIGHLSSLCIGIILAGIFEPKGYDLPIKIRVISIIIYISLAVIFFYFGYYRRSFGL